MQHIGMGVPLRAAEHARLRTEREAEEAEIEQPDDGRCAFVCTFQATTSERRQALMSFLKVRTPFSREKLRPLGALENAVVEAEVEVALYNRNSKVLTVLDRSLEAANFTKELRLLLQAPISRTLRRARAHAHHTHTPSLISQETVRNEAIIERTQQRPIAPEDVPRAMPSSLSGLHEKERLAMDQLRVDELGVADVEGGASDGAGVAADGLGDGSSIASDPLLSAGSSESSGSSYPTTTDANRAMGGSRFDRMQRPRHVGGRVAPNLRGDRAKKPERLRMCMPVWDNLEARPTDELGDDPAAPYLSMRLRQLRHKIAAAHGEDTLQTPPPIEPSRSVRRRETAARPPRGRRETAAWPPRDRRVTL